MSKIIIDVKGLIDHLDAMKAVTEVIKGGQISQTAKHKIPHYCWVTVFGKRIIVQARQKKDFTSPDSFIVYEK